MKWVFDRAAELALSSAIHSGHAVPITPELLLSVARTHTPTTQGWFEGVRTHAEQQAAPDGFVNDMRKVLSTTPTNTKKER